MATEQASSWWQGTTNPFPRAAVARTSALWPDAPTIETPAVTEMHWYIGDYVTGALEAVRAAGRPGAPLDEGRVIVVEGDYGEGKTHLVLEALGHLVKLAGDRLDLQPCYQVPPSDSFLALYTEIMRCRIGLDGMLARVRELYRDVIVDDLRGHRFAEGLVTMLEGNDGEEADPLLIIERYGLGEGALLAELSRRLDSVVGDEAFSQALILLLQPALRERAWDWLTGGVPGQLLREHGLARPIETDIQALEALGILAHVYRRKNRRFVLAIDEMEEIALGWDSSDEGKKQAFKRLLEEFRATGALLIMAGLPDIFDVLPPDTQSVDATIDLSSLKEGGVQWYIEKTIATHHGRATIEPFTSEGIDYIVYLTNGVARDVIRLCYYSYESAAISGGKITPAVVRTAALARSRRGTRDMVRNEIRRLLSEQARTPSENWAIATTPGVTADFWIPAGNQGAGCAILIADSILDDHQAKIAAEQISLLRSARPWRVVIQVVSGYLPTEPRRRIEEILNEGRLISYNPRTFGADFTGAATAVLSEVARDSARPSPGDAERLTQQQATTLELWTLRNETERLTRQHATMLRLIQDAADQQERLLSTVQRTLAGSALPPQLVPADAAEALPPELEGMFSAAASSLTAYGDVKALIDYAFASASDTPGSLLPLRSRLQDPDDFSPIGVMTFLADLLRGFRASVRLWFSSLETGREGADSATARERLRGICQAYDTLYRVAPLFKLDRLPDITRPAARDSEQLVPPSWAARVELVRDALDYLGDRVYVAASKLVETADGGPGRPAAGES